MVGGAGQINSRLSNRSMECGILDKKRLLGNLFLMLTALIWGMAFVAQRAGMDYVGPLTFSAVRFWLAAGALYPISLLMDNHSRISRAARSLSERRSERKNLIRAGFICGSVLFFAAALQQIGLVYTTAGKAGFITSLYIIIVPLFGIFLKQRPGYQAWIGVALATIGLYLLTFTEALTIMPGDLIMLIGAVFWATHVLFIGHFAPNTNAVKLSMVQFMVCASYSTIAMFLFEKPTLEGILAGAIPILYAGVLSGGVAYTFQIMGQRHTTPTVASLLLSMEAVFGAIFGFLILHEIMSGRELTGCVLMFVAIVISQLPRRR